MNDSIEKSREREKVTMTLKYFQIETKESCNKIFNLANELMRCGKVEEAVNLYDYLLIQDPSVPQYWIAAGIARMRKGELDNACALFQVAEAGDENDPVPVMLRGFCLMKMGRSMEALVALRRAQSSAMLSTDKQWVGEVVRESLKFFSENQFRNNDKV